jgi:hypothetical protein
MNLLSPFLHSLARFVPVAVLVVSGLPSALRAADLQLGIIGSDTSHVPAFTKILNDGAHPQHVSGARVVALHPAFSPDLSVSASRHDAFEKELVEKWGVRLEPTVESLVASVDAVLLESVDGRPHLEQARKVIAARKPLFIDKPLAGSLRDAVEIFRLAREARVPVFTSSAYRFYESLRELQKTDVGEIRSVISYGPCSLDASHPDLFWYGIHATEALFAVLGAGCETVSRVQTASNELVTGVWRDGRMGILHGLRNGVSPHRVMVFGSKAFAEQKSGRDDYAPLVAEIIKFFQTGTSPVSAEETLNLFAFMEAADESKRQGGAPVSLAEVLAKASRAP